jgi:LacI family transcriptional regulator
MRTFVKKSRPKLDEIARIAGVSKATVDRVLNNRSGVQEHTRLHVLKVMAELSGDAPSDSKDKPIRVDFVLPGGTNEFIADLAIHLERQGALRDYLEVVIHRLAGIEPEEIAARLETLRDVSQGVGLIGLDSPAVREAVRRLIANGVAG